MATLKKERRLVCKVCRANKPAKGLDNKMPEHLSLTTKVSCYASGLEAKTYWAEVDYV